MSDEKPDPRPMRSGAVSMQADTFDAQAILAGLCAIVEAIDAASEELETASGAVCALGALGKARGVNMTALDPEEPEDIARAFGIAESLAREVMFVNDELERWDTTPEKRWRRVREWVASQIMDRGDE